MGMYYEKKGGMCPDNAAPGNAAGAQCVRGGGRGRGGGGVEQQIRALGNLHSSFSSSSSSLCFRRGFDNNSALGSAVQRQCVLLSLNN